MSAIGWDNFLNWQGPTYPSLIKAMHASFSEVNTNEEVMSFKVKFSDQEILFSLAWISSIIGVPTNDWGRKSIKETLSKAERRMITKTNCSHVVPWVEGYFLQASSFLPPFRMLHGIFIFNLYPRRGNRSNLTPHMANVLYLVATRVPACLPSLICGTIVNSWHGPGRNACSFGSLLTNIALPYDRFPKCRVVTIQLYPVSAGSNISTGS